MKKGFTLIELLIVVVILGILIALVIGATTGNRARSNDERRRADMARIQGALEGCFADTGAYPANLQAACVTSAFPAGVPTDPTNAGANVYTYVQNSPTTYTLTAQMERITNQENINGTGLMTLNEKQ